MRIKIIYASSNKFNAVQQAYIRLAYWAISTVNMEEVDHDAEKRMKRFVYFFLLDLGISPFIKCYQKKTLIHACVRAERVDFLRELLRHDYEMADPQTFEVFEKSCKNKDHKGDNVFHEVFKLDVEKRNQFLNVIFQNHVKLYCSKIEPGCCKSNKVAIAQYTEEPKKVEIGEFGKRNRLSFKPTDYEHEYPIKVSSEIAEQSTTIQDELRDGLQADYVIVTEEAFPGDQKCKIITNQLDDLKLKKDKDFFIIVKHREMNYTDVKALQDSGKEIYDIYIAIKFSVELIDKIASNIGVFGDLDVSNIRLPYNKLMQNHFTQFDARQRYICIQKYLSEQIDFEHYQAIGVIKEHYPLHKRGMSEEISQSIGKYYWKLAITLITGSWYKYSQPLHLIKKYYGEKYAFYFTFLLTYQAWLLIPCIVGLVIFSLQMYDGATYGFTNKTLDMVANTWVGVALAIWATLVVTSWKNKQSKLMFKWDMDTPQDVLQNDERIGEHKF